ncbi:MAG TPA: type II toxin-antitoxin system Phd/YefM family antitoxin [Salinimicrobium sp.]|nr:type II toxin-antitoxin system Phd/YefM family antitoxin [Salinimicrobium sp.]
METINEKEFLSDLKGWFDRVTDEFIDKVIIRKKKKDLVLMRLDEYNSLKETEYLLDGANGEILLNSIKELEAGKGLPADKNQRKNGISNKGNPAR